MGFTNNGVMTVPEHLNTDQRFQGEISEGVSKTKTIKYILIDPDKERR